MMSSDTPSCWSGRGTGRAPPGRRADRALEDLDDGLFGRDVEDLAAAAPAAGRLDLDELAELDGDDLLDDDERPDDVRYGLVVRAHGTSQS
jgi:hypothetical protein